MKKIYVYDSTLRDGAQARGISFTVEDKIKIVKKLDYMGIDYIEAGNPGSNPKDLDFFNQISNIELKNAKIIAFGSTRKIKIKPEDDRNVQSLLKANTPAIAIFGKSWGFHVTDVLKTTYEENLNMIYETIKFFKERGKEVVFDAEHFFDGYKGNPEYALKSLEIAVKAGADSLALCDTNGGTFPSEIFEITKMVKSKFTAVIGIHCHNDTGMAVANTIMAVEAGALQIQGTINGYGERCGNANLITIIPNLQAKRDYQCIPTDKLKEITTISRYISELANIPNDDRSPYSGKSAFAHKGGMHVDAVKKIPSSFEHIEPGIVGNIREILMSEVSGRSTILRIINDVDSTITKSSPETIEIMNKLKELEHEGYVFEGAESSFELIIRKMLGKYKPSFELKEFKVIVNEPSIDGNSSSAIIKIRVGDEIEITAAEGDGPVNALDKALRKALVKFFPQINDMKLTDFKVRVLDTKAATAAKVRVLIESKDKNSDWTTIGVSTDIIEASWLALVDSIEYKLSKET